MRIKRIGLSLAAIIALSFSGCGSSDDSSSDSTDSSNVAGRAIDGYLEKALVCLDRNQNNDCDADEPMSITDSDGFYSLEGITEDDKSKYAILVKAILGQTKDSDDNGTTVTNAFFMKAPANNADVVSPITTIIQNKLENDPTMSIESAIAETKKSLKVSNDIDITGDYMANKLSDTNNTKVYDQLHKVAEVIADSIGESLATSNMSFGNSDFSDAGTIVLDNLDTQLSNIMSKTSDVNATTSSIMSDFNTTKTITPEEITDIKEKKDLIEKISNANQQVSDSKDYEIALRGDGLYTYWFYNWNNTPDLTIETTKVNDQNKLSWTWTQYDFDGANFVEQNATYETSFYKSVDTIYKLENGIWTTTTLEYDSSNPDGNEDVTFNDDGSMLSTSRWGTYKTTVESLVNLDGLAIKSMIGDNYWDDSETNTTAENFISDNVSFSPDATMIKVKAEDILDETISIYGENCWSDDASKVDKEDMECYDWSKAFDSNTDNNLTFNSIDSYKNYYNKGSDNYFYIENYKAQVDVNNTIYFFENDYSNTTLMPLTGELKEQTKNGAIFYEIVIPQEYTWNYNETNTTDDSETTKYASWDYSEILAVINGELRKGYWEKSAGWWIYKTYNKQAIDDIKNALETGLSTK